MFARKSIPARLIAIVVTILIIAGSQMYYAYNVSSLSYDSSLLLYGVVVPLLIGCFLLFASDQKAILLGFFGLFWSVVDDAPVSFDSILTWPEVTRFHPYIFHVAVEAILHAITLASLIAAVYITVKHWRASGRRVYVAYSLALLAFLVSYAQNIPLDSVQGLVEQSWYQLDVIEHLGCVCLFSASLLTASSWPRVLWEVRGFK